MNVLTDIKYTKKIYTHSNTFHTDEMMAISLLQQYVFPNERVEIIRTRDKNLLQKAREEEGTFVIDVGFIYDPAKLNFDHHQQDMNLGWDNGILFSSCGLIWNWLRENKVLNQHMNEETMNMMEETLIKRVDAADNGQGVWNEGAILSAYNRNDDTPDGSKQMKQFLRALAVTKDVLHNTFASVRSELKAKKTVEKCIKNSYNSKDQIIVMTDNTYHDYIGLAMELTDGNLNMLVIPHSRDKWTLRTAPVDIKDGFSRKNPAPESWRGRSDFIVEINGKKHKMLFAHKSGFMSIIDGNVDVAVEAAKHIVEWNQQLKTVDKKKNVNKSSLTMR